jgi:hypothetical protein
MAHLNRVPFLCRLFEACTKWTKKFGIIKVTAEEAKKRKAPFSNLCSVPDINVQTVLVVVLVGLLGNRFSIFLLNGKSVVYPAIVAGQEVFPWVTNPINCPSPKRRNKIVRCLKSRRNRYCGLGIVGEEIVHANQRKHSV